jgi:hypothetical protein
MTRTAARAWLLTLLLASVPGPGAAAPTPAATPQPTTDASPQAAERIQYEGDRLTVRATDVPLDRLLAEIAAVTKVTIRGTAPSRPVRVDFQAVPVREGLLRIFGEESFMLRYGSDGTLRAIDLLGRGDAVGTVAVASISPSPRPPLAKEEEQAAILRRPVRMEGALADALGTEEPALGQVLHAVLGQTDGALRAEAREQTLAAFARDPEAEAAYLSTLEPVDDETLAAMLRNMAAEPGAAEEWVAALATRAPSAKLRAKAAAVQTIMQRR